MASGGFHPNKTFDSVRSPISRNSAQRRKIPDVQSLLQMTSPKSPVSIRKSTKNSITPMKVLH